jgi:uncharacterized alkaline shock family protein YloU
MQEEMLDMTKFWDKLLLFIFSTVVFIVSTWFLCSASAWIPMDVNQAFLKHMYVSKVPGYSTIVISIVLMLISFRFLWAIIRSRRAQGPTIYQQNDWGHIEVTIKAIEQMACKAVNHISGLTDVKARIQQKADGLYVSIRVQIDGETPIPELSQEMQSLVKTQVQQMTAIPVTHVHVYIADLNQTSS